MYFIKRGYLSRQIKSCLISLFIREMKTKTPVRFHVHYQNISSVGEKLEQVEVSFSDNESINLCNHTRKASDNMIKAECIHIL